MKGPPRTSAGNAERPGRPQPRFRGGGGAAVTGLLALLLTGAGILAYSGTFDGAFIFDDMRIIVRNKQLHDPALLWSNVWASRRPLMTLSLALNHRMGGLDPWGYHLFNLVIHLLAGLTLFGLVRRTLLLPIFRQKYAYSSPWPAFVVALLWTLHPLQTQAVTYIIQRGESMMGLCYLLVLYCWVRGASVDGDRHGPLPQTGGHGHGGQPQRPGWLILAIGACALGMACKPVMVSAPLVVVLYDYVFLSRDFSVMLRRRWHAILGLAASIAVLGATRVIQQVLWPSGGANATVGFALDEVSWWQYLRTQPGVILHYLWLSIWPQSLCLDYTWPIAQRPSTIFGPGLVIVALLALTAWGLRRRSAAGYLGAWFFLILAPTSSFIPIADMAFEHRMYLSLAAIVALVVFIAHFGILRLLGAAPSAGPNDGTVRPATGRARLVGFTLAIVCAGLLAFRTHARNHDYHDSTAMWRSIVAARPENVRAMTNLALDLLEQGQTQEAIGLLRDAIGRKNDYPEAHQALGNALTRAGQAEEGLRHFQQAVAQDPRSAKARLNLGIALAGAKRYDEAITEYRAALSIQPASPEALNSLGLALLEKKKPAEAIEQFNRAIELDPNNDKPYNNRGIALRTTGLVDDAISDFRKAAELNANDGASRRNLGICLTVKGRLDEGIAFLEQAAILEPAHLGGRMALGEVCEKLGRGEQARQAYEAVLRQNPTHRQAMQRLEKLRGT